MATAIEIRQKAADLIEAKGWTRGKFSRNGHMCLVGALIHAAGNSPAWSAIEPPDAVTEAYLALQKELGTDNLFEWNDSRKRKIQVIAALRGQVA